MKFVDEYRDAKSVKRYAVLLSRALSRPWTIMEICGGQTHAIVRFGIDQLLPPGLNLVHGPGCPVCVTPVELIDKACAIAALPNVIFCIFGDMLRVPGSERDLLAVKAAGGDVRIVYSPLDALALAARHADRQVVFFAVGFETTAPANAMAAFQAKAQGRDNFSLLVSQVLVPPAMAAILDDPENQVQGFLAAGHVCAVMGLDEYRPIAAKYRVPIVATGFEPLDLLEGLYLCVRQLEEGRADVENQYQRAVQRHGNVAAQEMIRQVFAVVPRRWRGIGTIAASGLALTQDYQAFDAERRFAPALVPAQESPECLSGLILQGRKKPSDCPAFARRCTPERPLGATMVSSEGACAAYYRYRGEDGKSDATKEIL